MRTSNRKLNPSFKNQLVKTFAQVIVDLNKLSEAEDFLEDFFNKDEVETYSKRLAIAYWLTKKRSYLNIRENLKVSSATIATVEKLMKKPGFTLAIKKIEAEEWASVWAKKIRKFVRK